MIACSELLRLACTYIKQIAYTTRSVGCKNKDSHWTCFFYDGFRDQYRDMLFKFYMNWFLWVLLASGF